MAKLVLDDIGSTLTNTAATTINNNNNKIEQALENTLSRDGSTPNNMQADIDMDGNDLLNVKDLDVESIVLNGAVLTADETLVTLPATVMTKPVYDPQNKLSDAFDSSNHDFLQSGTGAVEKSVRTKLRESLSVEDFGASTSASASVNRAAFQAAIDRVKAIQGKLTIGPGVYNIDAALDLAGCSSVIIEGQGQGTVISTTSASAAIFSAVGSTVIDGLILRNIRLTSSVTRTAAPFISIDPMLQFSYIQNVVADNWGSFLHLKQFTVVIIRDCKFYQMASPPVGGFGVKAGTQASTNQGANLTLRDTILRGNGSGSATPSNWTVGLVMHDVEGIFTTGLDIADFDAGAIGDPQFRLANCFFDSSFFDATQRGPSFRFQGTGVKVENEFCASWFASAGRSGTPTAADGAYGFSAIGTGAYGRTMFTGCRFYNNASSGVNISTANFDADFVGCNFYFNSKVDSSNAFISDTTGSVPNLKDCKFTDNDAGASSVSYTATSSGYVVSDIISDGPVSLLGSPARCHNIVASNSTVIASAATVTLLPFNDFLTISGTTTISAISASTTSRVVSLLFQSALTVTHGANLVLKGAVNATTANGSVITFLYNGSGQWREVSRNF